MNLLFLIVISLVLLALRLPVALALLLPAVLYVAADPQISMSTVINRLVAGVDSFTLLAIPLFVLAGNLLNETKATDRLFEWIESLVGRLRGSLAYANIGTSFVFAGMSGSATADVAGIGAVQVKAMERRGYPVPFTLGITAASSTIGPILPPSVPAVIYASAAGVSVGAVFIAGIIPAVVMALVLAASVFAIARLGRLPAAHKWVGSRAVLVLTMRAIPALGTPVILLGGIFSGIFTATESAAVAAGYAMAIGVFPYRSLTVQKLKRALASTAEATITVLIVVAASSVFAYVLAVEGAASLAASLILQVPGGFVGAVIAMNVALLLLGTVLEPLSALVIVTPILLPIAIELGMDPVQFGIMIILNLMIGLLTPPVGLVLFILSRVSGWPVATVLRGVVPFYLPLIAVVFLIAFVPVVTLALL